MGAAARIGALVPAVLAVGCTWIPLDGPLGRDGPADVSDTDTDSDSDVDTDTAPDTTGDTGIETDTDIGVVDGELDLARARALLVGEAPEDHSTAAFAVGELTGDGVTDLVIGSWWWDTNEDGSAYVMSADAVGRVSLADAGARLTGGAGTVLVGCSLGVGDLNGDLQDDLLVGAYDEAFVVAGPVSGTARARDLALTRFERPGSEQPGVCFGMSPAGDINTDGDADLLITYDERSYPSTVSVFVADTSVPGPIDLDDLPDRVAGPVQSVGAVTTADVDGDGTQDVLLGDYREATVSVLHGPIVGIVPTDSADAVLSGAGPFSAFGVFALNAGDMNDDGREDVLVSAVGAVQDPPIPGTAYLWTTELDGVQLATSADAIFVGVEPGSGTSGGLAVADVDGDGERDVVLGATLSGFGTLDIGYGGAWLLYGPFSGFVDFDDAVFLRGDRTQPGSFMGNPLASLGDVDGDGLGDLAVGASGLENYSGGTYLLFGNDF